MPYFPKKKVALVPIILGLILFAFMFLLATNTITNVSSVETDGVGVYWDSDCTDRVFLIDWGILEPGSVKNIVVYVRNEAGESMCLLISTMNWNPSKASGYITLGSDCSGRQMKPSETFQTTLTLSVNRYIEGISSFSFDILVTARDSLLGDLNEDGKIDMRDIAIVSEAYGSYPGHPDWNPTADIVPDNKIDMRDVSLIAANYGKTA